MVGGSGDPAGPVAGVLHDVAEGLVRVERRFARETEDAFAEMAGHDDLVGGRLDQLLGDTAWDDISHQRGELLSEQELIHLKIIPRMLQNIFRN